MLNLHRSLSRISISSLISKPLTKTLPTDPQIASNGFKSIEIPISQRLFSTSSGIGGGGKRDDDDEQSDPWSKPWESSTDSSDMGWDSVSTWSTGLTKDHFDGEVVGRKVNPSGPQSETPRSSSAAQCGEEQDSVVAELLEENKWSEKFVNSWNQRMSELNGVMKQVREPGMRGEYLKDSEKAEMYRLHKSDPEVYTVEKLAKDYKIMRQRVHAILWLKELEEQEEKERGPLDDSVELLLDTCPEFFVSHDREFHLASLPYKPDFKVMPEGWDGTTRDPDEVHYEISMKEDEMLYQEFVQRMNFNKMKFAGKVNKHIYSRRRSDKGWKITVEKLGPEGKRGRDKFSGGWKYVSEPDGSSRPLNDMEKMYVQRETPRRRKKILP